MVMYYLIVKDGIIENAIAWDGQGEYTPPEGHELVSTDQFFSIGWLWIDGHPVDPHPPVPMA
jgi:hypothetical protein